VPNVALDILVNVVKTKILLIFISLSSFVFIFVLVLVSSTIIQNVFVIFVIVFVVVDEKTLFISRLASAAEHPCCCMVLMRKERKEINGSFQSALIYWRSQQRS